MRPGKELVGDVTAVLAMLDHSENETGRFRRGFRFFVQAWLVDRGSSHRLFLPEHTLDPVAEAFTGGAFGLVADEERTQLSLGVGFLEQILPDLVQARAVLVAAEPDLVAAGAFARTRSRPCRDARSHSGSRSCE